MKCVKCGAEAVTNSLPASCSDCHDVIKAWKAVSIRLPEMFTTRLYEWEKERIPRESGMLSNKIPIKDSEVTVETYPFLVKALEKALNVKSEIVIFDSRYYTVKEVKEYISEMEMN